jgi:uncharacterized protein involved in outer membrane biogenesis
LEETGRKLTIGGPITLEVGAETVFSISDVQFANADWGSRPQMATVAEFEAVVRLIPTLFGTPDIALIRLRGVDVLVETNADGLSNTAFGQAGAPEEGGHEDEGPGQIEAPEGGAITIPILRDVLIEDITATIRNAKAGTENVFTLDHLTLAGEGAESPLTLDLEAAFDGLPLIMAGTLGAPAAMQDSGQRWDVDLTGNLAGVDVAATGGIMEPTKGRGFDIALSALGQELADIARKVGVDVPKVGPFEVRAILKGDSDDDLLADDITVNIGAPDFIHITVAGKIASLTKAAGIDLQVGVEGVETGNLSPLADRFAGQTVPDMGPYKIAMRVSGGLERGISVTGLDAALGKTGLILLSAKGGIADALNGAGVDITLAVRSNQIGALSDIAKSYTGQGVPALGPLDVGARLVGDLPMPGRGARKIAVNDLDFALGAEDMIRITAVGGVADVMAQNGITLDVTAKSQELGRLDTLAKTYTGGQGMPNLGPLDLTLSVAGGMDSTLSVPTLALDMGRDQTLHVTASGSVDDALRGSGADLSFSLKSPDLSLLSELAGSPVPSIGPVDVTGVVKAGADAPVTLEPFTAKIGGSDISGSIIADLRDAVPSIVAKLSSQNFDTRDLTGENAGGQKPAAKPASDTAASPDGEQADGDDERVIPADPLPLDALGMVNADIRYTAANLNLAGSQMTNFQLAAALKDARFTIDTLTADVGAGTLDGTISLDGGKTPAPLVIDITGSDMDLGLLGGAAGLKNKLEGPLDLRIDLKGAGNSPREIASGMNGAFSAVIVDSRVRREAVEDAMGANMTRLADVLFGNEGEWVLVNCALVDYSVTDGLMDANALYVDTDVSTVTGDGEIDLKTEELSIGLKPQTGIISIPLLVTGTLASPTVIPDPGKTLLSIGGALLTGGGLTAALAVLSASLPEDHPCMTSAEAAKAEAAEDANKSTGDKVLDAPGDALKGVQGVTDGLSDGINKLFGQ